MGGRQLSTKDLEQTSALQAPHKDKEAEGMIPITTSTMHLLHICLVLLFSQHCTMTCLISSRKS